MAYMVNKDHHLALPWGWRIFCSWNSPFDFSFLRQGADANHLIQLSLSNSGASLVAGSELFGHCETKQAENERPVYKLRMIICKRQGSKKHTDMRNGVNRRLMQ